MIALDAATPALFFYSDQLFSGSPINSISLGVSGAKTIPFTPWHSDGVESKMTSFNGELYLGGSVNIPTQIPAVAAQVTGDMTVNVNNENFVNGNINAWIVDLGINGDLALEAGLGPFSLTYGLGGATLRYHRGSPNWLAFSGVAQPDDLGGLPFTPKSNAYVAGYLSSDVSQSFLTIEGDPISGTHCDSTGSDASLTSSGQIRVCVNIPAVGEKCDTLG